MSSRSYEHLVNKIIVPGDTMYHGNSDYYFKVGESAISVIDACLSAAGAGEVNSILDYACGYGRVLRWTKARFPDARILASDVDEKALAAVKDTLGVETRVADVECCQDFGETFDLIWSGSLFTHLRESDTCRVLRFLFRQLSQRGILIFTTHGPYVERRIAEEDKLYGLESDAKDWLVSAYLKTGYGFGAYPHQPSYGISAVTSAKMMTLVEQTGYEPIFYLERGWIQHQDVYAVHAAA